MFMLTVIFSLLGCEPYRIEYHKRSAIFFNEEFVEGGLDSRITLDDGTVIINEPYSRKSNFGRSGGKSREPFKIREETEDGEIIFRALIPQHVILNLFNCLQNQEYELIYEKLLSEDTRAAYEASGGFKSFETYMGKNRLELGKMLRRMIVGQPHNEVKIRKIGDGLTELKLVRRVAEQFRFKSLELSRTGMYYQLHMIR